MSATQLTISIQLAGGKQVSATLGQVAAGLRGTGTDAKRAGGLLDQYGREIAQVGKETKALPKEFPVPKPPAGPSPYKKTAVEGREANFALIELSRITQDFSSLAGVDLVRAIGSASNNVEGFTRSIVAARAEALAGGKTLKDGLVASLTGSGGLVLGITAAIALLPVITAGLSKLFGDSAREAEKAKKRYEAALAEAVNFNLSAPSVTFTTPEAVQADVDRLEQQRRALEANREAISNQLSIEYSRTLGEYSVGIARYEKKLQEANRALDENKDRLDASREALAGYNEQVRLAGEASNFTDAQQAALDTYIEKARESNELRLRLAGKSEADLTREQITGLEERARDQGLSFEERYTLLTQARSLENDLLRDQLTEREQARQQARQKSVARQREHAALIQSLTEEREANRIAAITDGRARELEEVAQWQARQVEAAKGQADALVLIAEVAGQKRAAITLRYTREMMEERARLLDRAFALDQRRARLAGASEADLLDAQAERLRARLGGGLLGLSAIDPAAAAEVIEQLREIEVRKAEVTQAGAERRAQIEAQHEARMDALREDRVRLSGASEAEIVAGRRLAYQDELALLDAKEALTDEEYRIRLQLIEKLAALDNADLARQKRALAERAALVEQFTRAYLDAVADALFQERDLSDEEIASRRDRFKEEEDELKASLRAREISQEEYHRAIRELREEERRFDQEVREDQLSTATRVLVAIAELTKSIALDIINAEIAVAIAAAVRNEAQRTGLFGLIAGGVAAFAAATAIKGAITGTFASGGYVGRAGEAGRDDVPVMLGRGEAVLNRHQQKVVNAALIQTTGRDLSDLFARVRNPHYLAQGGFVDPLPPYRRGDVPGQLGAQMMANDAARETAGVRAAQRLGEQMERATRVIEAQGEQLRRQGEELKRMKQSPPAFHATPAEQRRANRAAEADASATLPRRKLGRPGRGS